MCLVYCILMRNVVFMKYFLRVYEVCIFQVLYVFGLLIFDINFGVFFVQGLNIFSIVFYLFVVGFKYKSIIVMFFYSLSQFMNVNKMWQEYVMCYL